MPHFSIVIPAYNRAHFLGECLDSVLAQTFADWECLVVDDGSTDGTRDMVAGYVARDARFRYQWQENGGASAARNTGMALAQGTWIAFLDSDDSYLPSTLQMFQEASDAHPEVSVLTGYLDVPWAAAPGNTHSVAVRDTFFDVIGFGPGPAFPMAPTGSAIRRQAVTEIGPFVTAYPTSEDHEFWIRATARYRVGVIDAVVAHYRHDGGDSKFNAFMASGRKFGVLRQILADVVQHPAVVQRLSGDPNRPQFERWHAQTLLVLETAAHVRAGEMGQAAASRGGAGGAPAAAVHGDGILERLKQYLFFPRTEPLAASRRCARWFWSVARAIPRGQAPDLRARLRAHASDTCYFQAGDLLAEGKRREAWQAAWFGLRSTCSWRSIRSTGLILTLLARRGRPRPL